MSDPKHPTLLEQLREPYYIVVVAVLGGITAVFAVLITLLILVATNFNVLSLIE